MKSLPTFVIAILSASLLTTIGHGQQTNNQADNAERVYDLPAFEVTGSFIRQFDEQTARPVTVMNFEDLEGSGYLTASEFLNDLSFAGGVSIGEGAEGPNDARGDVSSINLRELGPGNTLVLLNSRRLTPHPISQSLSGTPTLVVNVNTIPDAAVQRMEILRDGASALYGTDATAGVVNTILRRDFEGSRLTFRYGFSEDTTFREYRVDLAHGVNFNNNRTNFSIFAQYFDRNPMKASERSYAATDDKRPLLPEEWEGNVNFRNISAISPWGRFQLGSFGANGEFVPTGRVARTGPTNNLSNETGIFSIRPAELSTLGVPSPQNPNNFIVPSQLTLEELRYDTGDTRWLTPQTTRFSLYSVLNHTLTDNLSTYFEFGYYTADSEMNRAPIALDETLAFLIVPKQNYWNPFGPVGSPNRIPGNINFGVGAGATPIPDEGLDALVLRYRPVELGPRLVYVESSSYRFVGGLRGQVNNWSWDSGVVWSVSKTTDTNDNYQSKTLLLRDLALDTPEAFNPFDGPFANPESVLERSRISITRQGETQLGIIDFRASNYDIYELASGPIGFAFGFEYRYESYADIRDPRLNGTIVFDPAMVPVMFPEIPASFIPEGYLPDNSDVVGVSATVDTNASRDVLSAFSELNIPFFSRRNAVPGIHRLEMQLAARYEHFSDFGDTLKPKAAISYYPIPWAFLRTSYSMGFRAPNLSQLYEGETERLPAGEPDFYRVMNLPAGLLNDRDRGNTRRRIASGGNADLTPEESESVTVGLVISPPVVDGLTISVDWWSIRQTDVIGRFGTTEQIALDAYLRDTTPDLFNPDVIRMQPTQTEIEVFEILGKSPAGEILRVNNPALNLDSRKVRGMDFALNYAIPWTRLGNFTFDMTASYYMKYEETRSDLDFLRDYVDEVLLPRGLDVSQLEVLFPDKRQRDGNPKYRLDASLAWRKGSWGARARVNYIDYFYDTNAIHETTGEYWRVADSTRVDLSADYRFRLGNRGSRFLIRIGVRNVFNEDPPLTSHARGYDWRYHSNRGRYWFTTLRTNF